MTNFADYQVRVHEKSNFYEIEDGFGYEDGFMIAAAVTAFDGSAEDITDLSIGRLRFVMKSFDSSRAENLRQFIDIETGPCDGT